MFVCIEGTGAALSCACRAAKLRSNFATFPFRFAFVMLAAYNLIVLSCKASESVWLEVVKFITAVRSAAVAAVKCSNASVTFC